MYLKTHPQQVQQKKSFSFPAEWNEIVDTPTRCFWWSQNSNKKNCVRFSPLGENKTNTYNRLQWNHSNDEEDMEKHYLSSGLNSQAELEILYAARGTEISQLTAELHQLHHQVALLGIFCN